MRDKEFLREKKNAKLALILSIVPGLPHLYLRRIKKAVSLLVIDAGLILALFLSDSYLIKIIIANIYLFTFLPALLESYSIARDKKSRINTDSKWYVVILLLTTGFNALPLLWQNRAFSKKFKIIWTIIVPLLALLFAIGLFMYWNTLESLLANLFE